MKHIITVLLICFSFVAYGQDDLSEILKGEWLVSPISVNATFTQTWNFTSDSTLVVTRKDNTEEKYDYEIDEAVLIIKTTTSDSLDVIKNNDTDFFVYKYSETNFVGYGMPTNSNSSNIKLMFTKKNSINLVQSFIQLDDFLFLNKTYKISSSKGAKLWHDKFVRSFTNFYTVFVEDTCATYLEYYVVNTPYFSMITFEEWGSVQVIEKRDSSWIKAINLNDKNDTITFELIENESTNFIKSKGILQLKELKKENLNHVLNGQSILSIGMGNLQLLENGIGIFKSGSRAFEIDWFYFFNYIIVFEYETKELEPGRNGFSRIVTVQKVIYLKLEQLKNGKILATKLNCGEEKTYFVEK